MTDAASWPALSIAQAHALLTAPGAPFEMATRDIRGIRTRTWLNAPPTLRDVFLAGRTHGDRDFLVHDDERVTFAAFARATATLAAQFTADGVVKGDRVAIVMRNLPEWPVAFFAAALCGAIVTPLNAWWTGAELEYGLIDSGATTLVADAERLARLTDHLPNCPALTRVYVSRATEPGTARRLEDVIGAPADWAALPDVALPTLALDPEDDATIFYTSGTTGRPKGALGTHRNIVSNIMASGISAARSALRRGEMPVPPDPAAPQKGTLLSVPFFHATGCHAILSPSLFAGAKLVMMRKWDVEAAMALIARERLTTCGGVPTIAWQIIEHPARANYDLSSLETVAYGGAPSAPELVRQIGAALRSTAGNGWGMTETSATFTHHQGEDYVHRPDSAGPPVPVCDVRVTDPDGREVPVGTVGELWGRGPNIVKEYWRKPAATAETFIDGWVRTGDLARVDDEGFVFIVDRAKDMLIRGGENIYCVEVENALYEHPAVMDAAIVARPHHSLGEEPAAVVTLRPGATATADELRRHVAARLAGYKVPVDVRFWGGPLPRNANGKILKSELKTLFAAAAPPVAAAPVAAAAASAAPAAATPVAAAA